MDSPALKTIIVGESNPYGDAPEHALYPYPTHSAGGRLCRVVMGLQPTDYVRRFDRRNLCVGRWNLRAAREVAAGIRETAHRLHVSVVLLGSNVTRAFGIAFKPYQTVYEVFEAGVYTDRDTCAEYVVLPHPSGRNRMWNEPGAVARAREALGPILGYNPAAEVPNAHGGR